MSHLFKNFKYLTLIALSLLPIITWAFPTTTIQSTIPASNQIKPQIKTNCYIQPCSIKGDLDDDGKNDEMTLVENISNNKRGIKFVLSKNNSEFILGAGNLFYNAGDDLTGFTNWHIATEEEINQSHKYGLPITIKTGIIIERNDASGLIYLFKNDFKWHQRGD